MQLENLKVSTLAEMGPLKIAQPIKIPLFLDLTEMQDLIDCLEQSYELLFFNTHDVVPKSEGIFSSKKFIAIYNNYIDDLKEKKIPHLKYYHPFFSSSLSTTSEIFYAISLGESERIIKAFRPPIQLQPHHIFYSKESQALYSMACSENNITFGIQLSYPNLYQDSHTHEIIRVDESGLFPNTALFKAIRHWVRNHTLPVSFLINDKKSILPIRLGRKCFAWINQHPQLQSQNLYVNT